MADELIAFLRARYDDDERPARAAKPGPWHVEEDRQDLTRWVANEERSLEVGLGYVGNRTQDDAAHIAQHNPARVLREIEAKRKLVEDLLAEKHDVVDDCWYTCAAATEDRDGGKTCDDNRRGGPCDCGRDARVARRLGFLALPYADHPGFKEEWRP